MTTAAAAPLQTALTRYKLTEAEAARQDGQRAIVNSEFIVFYGDDVDRYLPPLPDKERIRTNAARPRLPRPCSAPAWACSNPAMRQLSNLRHRGPRTVLPGQSVVKRPALLTPELRRPHTAVESSVKSILNTRLPVRPKTSAGKIESMSFRLSQPPAEEPELIKPKKVKVLDVDKDVDTISLASSVAGRFRQPRFIKPGPKKKVSRRRRTAAHQILSKERAETVGRVLRGSLTDLPQVVPAKVKLYLSATTHDFKEERKVLQSTALPKLREHCMRQGLELQLVDYPQTTPGEPQNISLQLEELDACRKTSFGPYFVTLLGDYTGPVVLPPSLPEEDFDLFAYVADHHNLDNAALMSTFYLEDTNSQPTVYLLQMDEVRGPHFSTFCELFTKILVVAEQTQRITEATRQYYDLVSAREREAKRAVFDFKDTATISSLAFIRKFNNINPLHKNAAVFTNLDAADRSELDAGLWERRDHLAQRLRHNLYDEANVCSYSLTWAAPGGVLGQDSGADPAILEEHAAYLAQFSADFVDGIKRLIDINRQRWCTSHPQDHVFNEVLKHAHVTSAHAKVFSGRGEILKYIEQYLKGSSGAVPLVLYGHPGVGRSALASAVASRARDWLGRDTATVVRHCGLTDRSGHVCDLLVYLCLQICAIYNMEAPRAADRSSVNRMSRHFQLLLELVSLHHARKGSLVIILDDIDRLADSDRAETLFWLPREMPDNVRLVVTLAAGSQALLEQLRRRLGGTGANLLPVNNLSEREILSMVITTLRSSGRRLDPDQVAALANVSKANPHPAFVSTLSRVALGWCSWTFVDYELLPVAVDDALAKLIFSMQHGFGDLLTDRLLCYLTLLPGGLSEMELRDAIVTDEQVLEGLLLNSTPSMAGAEGEAGRLFMLTQLHHLLTRALRELSPLLRVEHRDGRELLCWAHDQFRDVLRAFMFDQDDTYSEPGEKVSLYQQNLADVLQQEESVVKELGPAGAHLDCGTLPQLLLPTALHKLRTIPELIYEALPHEEALPLLKETCLCNFSWLLTKLQAVSPKEVLRDYELVEGAADGEVELVASFLRLAGPRALALEPLSLAAQLLGAVPCLPAREYPMLNRMVADAYSFLEDTLHAMLVPLFPVFPAPNAFCQHKLWGLVDVVALDDAGRLAVTRADNGNIDVWDMSTRELAYELGAKYNKTHPNIYCSSERVFAIEEGLIAKVWEIESGHMLHEVNMAALLGGNISSCFLFCHDEGYTKISIHTSDEDFNQTIAVIDMETGTLLHRIIHFDVKDEFFRDSATFTGDGRWLVFVNARSQLMDDGKTTDYAKMHLMSLQTGQVEKEVKCGEKKLHCLLPRGDGTCLVCWTDASSDVYNTDMGAHSCHLNAPDSGLQLQQCFLSGDGNLMVLASTVTPQYYGLWYWGSDERPPVQLVHQTYTEEVQVATSCMLIEELHLALLAQQETAVVSVWELTTGQCIHSFQAHTEIVDHMIRAPREPHRFYTCSSGEEVVKQWDLSSVLSQIRAQRSKRKRKAKSGGGAARTSPVHNIRRPATTEGILKKPGPRSRSAAAAGRKSVRFAESDQVEGEESPRAILVAESLMPVDNTVDAMTEDGDYEDVIGARDPAMVRCQLRHSEGVTCVDIARDNTVLVSGSHRGLPVVWDCSTGDVLKVMSRYHDSDVSTPWVALCVDETCVVGLTVEEATLKTYPHFYMYQVWSRESGTPLLSSGARQFCATACALMPDRERSVIACFDDDEGTKDKQELLFHVLHIESHSVVHSVRFPDSAAVPTEMTIADDNLHAVTNNVPGDNGKATGESMVFKVGKEQEEDVAEEELASVREPPVARSYTFRVGSKYREYKATQAVLISNGMAISSGLNGDMQMWDIATTEYEGNLYCDPTVKEIRDPNLHNYGGKRALHLAVAENGSYLVAGLNDGSAVLWDLDNDALCYTYKGHSMEVCCVAISHDNQVVLTSSRDGSICVWQWATSERPLARLHVYAAPTHLHVSRDKRSVVAVTARRNEPARMMLFNLRNTFTD